MNPTLLTPDGKPAPAAVTEAKLEHDSAALKRQTDHLNKLARTLFTEYMNDVRPDPENPALVDLDLDAIRAHYGERWAEVARTVNRTGFPHAVPEDRLYLLIDQYQESVATEAELDKPITTRSKFHLLSLSFVTKVRAGSLYLNSECAVSASDDGYVQVWLRGPETMDSWVKGWMGTPVRRPALATGQYTFRHLHGLLSALQIGRVVALPEALLHVAGTHRRHTLWPW